MAITESDSAHKFLSRKVTLTGALGKVVLTFFVDIHAIFIVKRVGYCIQNNNR